MKITLLASIAALFLATGAAHAGGPHDFKCGPLSLTVQSVTETNRYGISIEGITNERRVEFRTRRGKDGYDTPYINGKRCRECTVELCPWMKND
jgi:hypothetical protein